MAAVLAARIKTAQNVHFARFINKSVISTPLAEFDQKKRHGEGLVPCPLPGSAGTAYWRMTWSSLLRPFNTSVLAPLEIPMLIATFRFPSLPLASGTSTEALRSLSYKMEPSGI